MKTRIKNYLGRIGWLILTAILSLHLYAADEQKFASTNAAVTALIKAAQSHDTNALHAIFGAEAHDLVSPDMVQATNEFGLFVRRLADGVELVPRSDNSFFLHLGLDGWPFPIPLKKQSDGQWYFDTVAGAEEILNRRIGMNELGAIAVCHAYVDAQHEYASQDRGSGVLEFAQHLRSTEGTHDGLFWPRKDGDELSPFGPLVAQAHGEGYTRETKILNDPQTPYHGYYFKVLTRQGSSALGGKFSYIVNGHMVGGFALAAWPAEWGNSGVMTFIVNQQGRVFQKNLGLKTSSIAAQMNVFNPDKTWSEVGN